MVYIYKIGMINKIKMMIQVGEDERIRENMIDKLPMFPSFLSLTISIFIMHHYRPTESGM